MTIAVLDPTNGPILETSSLPTASRPLSLQAKTLGVIANGVGDSEMMFDALAALLVEEDGLADVVKVVKASVAVPPYPEQWKRIVEDAHVVVTGFGGCGSCSTRSVRDAVDLEAIGIPAVCIVHTALVPAVRAMSRLIGNADYPVVIVEYPHNPTGAWTKDEAAEIAAQVAPLVRQRLTAQL